MRARSWFAWAVVCLVIFLVTMASSQNSSHGMAATPYAAHRFPNGRAVLPPPPGGVVVSSPGWTPVNVISALSGLAFLINAVTGLVVAFKGKKPVATDGGVGGDGGGGGGREDDGRDRPRRGYRGYNYDYDERPRRVGGLDD